MKRRVSAHIATFSVALLVAAIRLLAQGGAVESPVNLRITNYCRTNLGQRVGDGTNTSFMAAVSTAATIERSFVDAPREGDKVWGTYIEKISIAAGKYCLALQAGAMRGSHQLGAFLAPGDVLEFDGVRFMDQYGNSVDYPQHYTTIISKVSPNGRYCRVYEQGGPAGGSVILATLFLPSLNAGSIRAYKPVNFVPTSPVPDLPMNEALLAYCRRTIGRKVGGGQCAELVSNGLPAIGAACGFRDTPTPGSYVWGALVCTLKVINGQQVVIAGTHKRPEVIPEVNCIEPGDILQFSGAMFRWVKPHGWEAMAAAHHTSVVDQVIPGTDQCKVLEQNSGGRLYVTHGSFPLSGMYEGEIRAYRPVPN